MTIIFVTTPMHMRLDHKYVAVTLLMDYMTLKYIVISVGQASAFRTRLRNQGRCQQFWRCEKRVR